MSLDTRMLCLGALTGGPMSGYEIKKSFENQFRHFFVAGFSSIYPALADLAAEGLVEVTSVEQEKRPDKKLYRLTERGRTAFVDELAATPPRHKVRSEFMVLMWFAHLLPPGRAAEVLDAMEAEWQRVLEDEIACAERAAGSGEWQPTPGELFAVGYGRAVLGAALAYLRRQRGMMLRELEADRTERGNDAARAAARDHSTRGETAPMALAGE